MRAFASPRLVAALLAPVVLVSGAAQGLMLMRCGSSVRVSASCCCEKERAPAPASELKPGAQGCCDRVAVPAAPPQLEQRSPAPLPGPTLAALQLPAASIVGSLYRELPVPRLDPPAAPSPLLATCSLLI